MGKRTLILSVTLTSCSPDGTPPGPGSRYEEDRDHSCSSPRKTRDQRSVVRI